MYSIENLNITSSRNVSVPNTFFRQKSETRHLAILLPGLGYTSHMPVMYYPCMALLARGADVLRADYNYIINSDFMALPQDERRQGAALDALATYIGALRQREYDLLTLVGKSIGTYAMGYVITSVTDLPNLQCLWLTPILKNEHLLSQIKQIRHKALFVTGTADPYYDKTNLEDLVNATGGESLIVDGADHSLEISGDPIRSIAVLDFVMNGIAKFLG